MLDVVVNDMAWAGNASTVDYSQFNPFNSEEYFHPYRLLSDDPSNETCVIDVSTYTNSPYSYNARWMNC